MVRNSRQVLYECSPTVSVFCTVARMAVLVLRIADLEDQNGLNLFCGKMMTFVKIFGIIGMEKDRTLFVSKDDEGDTIYAQAFCVLHKTPNYFDWRR